MGLAIASLIALIALVFCKSETWSDVPKQFFDFAAIPSAIWIAYIGWRAISKQIANDRELEFQRNRSLLEAARASLPLALTQLVDVCRRAILFTYQTDRHQSGAVEIAKGFAMPSEALSILKECISYSETNVAKRLANVIRHYQVAYSRTISSYEEPDVGKSPFTDTFDWAVVRLLLNDCFRFARGSSDTIPSEITEGSLYSVFLSFNDVNFLNDHDFTEEMKLRAKHGNLESLWDR